MPARLTAADLEAKGWCPETGRRVADERRIVPRYPGTPAPAAPPPAPNKANKYSAIRTEGPDPCGGTRVYASKREAKRAHELALLKSHEAIADWFAQVPIAYGVRADGKPAKTIIDFLVIHDYRPDGTFVAEFQDAKGKNLEASQAKFAALRGRGMQVRLV